MQRLMARVWKFALWDHRFGISVLIFVPSVVVTSVGIAISWLPPYAPLVPFIIPVGILGIILAAVVYRGARKIPGT